MHEKLVILLGCLGSAAALSVADDLRIPAYGESQIQLDPPGAVFATASQKAAKRKEQLRALNFVVNGLSQKRDLVALPDSVLKAPGGIATVSLTPPLTLAQSTLLQAKNPYRCSLETNQPLRLDWLTSFAFGPDYYRALGLDMSENGLNAVASLEKLVGLKFDFKSPVWKKALYRKGESRITRFRRSVMRAFSPTLNGELWVTIDQDLEKLGEGVSPFEIQSGNNATVAAGEVIGTLPNGMPFYALITRNAEGKLVLAESAPDNLVSNNFSQKSYWRAGHFTSGHGDKPLSIENAQHCQTCHRDGTIGPKSGLSLGEPEIKKLLRAFAAKSADKAAAQRLLEEANTFSLLTEEDYVESAGRNGRNLAATLKKANAYLPDPLDPESNSPFLADITKEYRRPLSLEQVARELGTNATSAKRALALVDQRNDSIALALDGSRATLSRPLFEKFYCELKAALNIPNPKGRGAVGEDSKNKPTH